MPNKKDYEKNRQAYIDYSTRWGKANKDKVKVFRASVRAARRAWMDQLKSGPCVDCKNTYPPCVMDFDHVRGEKFKNLAAMPGYPEDIILEEIAKCDLICSNCHRIRTHLGKEA